MAWQLQSSVHGKIRRLLMVEYAKYSDAFREVLIQMFWKKSPHTQLIVWADSTAAKEGLAKFLNNQKPRIETTFNEKATDPSAILLVSIHRSTGFESWARDPFIVFHDYDSELKTMAYRYVHNGYNSYNFNKELPDLLHEKGLLNLNDEDSNLSFEGGDILADDDYVLVGGDAFNKMMARLGTSNIEECKQKLLKLLHSENARIFIIDHNVNIQKIVKSRETYPIEYGAKLNKAALAIGRDFAHIDTYLTLTGEIALPSGKPIVLLAKLIEHETNEPEIVHLNDKLDMIEKELSGHFHLIRNILPCLLIDGSWYILYYNNCLVENTLASKKVWLPCFSCLFDEHPNIQKLTLNYQDCNVNIWKALGFEVKLINANFIPFEDRGGSLHCMTKELVREKN